MRILLLAILLGSNILVTQSPRTVEQALGKEKVRSILNQVIMRKIEAFSSSYVITDLSFSRARSAGVPVTTLGKLESVKGREIHGEDEFEKTLQGAIGQEDSKKYESLMAANARGYLIVTDKFSRRVEDLVLNTEAPDTGDVTDWLEKGIDRFLTDYISFSKQSSYEVRAAAVNKVSPNRITLAAENANDVRLFDRFIKAQRARCGEIPCSVPPCCGKECNACK